MSENGTVIMLAAMPFPPFRDAKLTAEAVATYDAWLERLERLPH